MFCLFLQFVCRRARDSESFNLLGETLSDVMFLMQIRSVQKIVAFFRKFIYFFFVWKNRYDFIRENAHCIVILFLHISNKKNIFKKGIISRRLGIRYVNAFDYLKIRCRCGMEMQMQSADDFHL